jgi:hexosaminidase
LSAINIIPQPVHVSAAAGSFDLNRDVTIQAPGAAQRSGQQLAALLGPALGFWLPVTDSFDAPGPGSRVIVLRLDDQLADRLGPEGYRLVIAPERVELTAGAEAGLFYAAQSLRQLLPPDVFRSATVQEAWQLPAVEIEDRPRFGWRGAHLDVGRHFMPKSFIKKYLDLMALHKLNVFHWHLTDDQGWRIEIKRYPRLTEIGAWRKETVVGHWSRSEPMTYDGKPHGGFYTQEDIREIVQYAAERHITILPEIEMPGHAQAAIAAYPGLGNTNQQLEVSPDWGVNENVFNANESTILFLQDVLVEVDGLFPGTYLHIGGDECPKRQWRESPEAQARMKELGLKDEDELQSYFIRRMDAFLNARGRRLVGWDEILEGGLAPNAVVMSWRGENGGIAAAQAAHDVVMAPYQYTYFDYYQSEDRAAEPLAIGGYLPLEKAYTYEPIPAALTPEEGQHVLGAQGQIWTEYIPDYQQVEYMAFPRLAALAEVVWTPVERKNYADFRDRLATHLKRLEILDVNYRKLT